MGSYVPPRIRLGDIDSDGYPDILVTIQYLNGTSRPHIFLNRESKSELPANDENIREDEDLEKIVQINQKE